MALSEAGALEALAGWAMATSSASCYRRRSMPLLTSASSLCRLASHSFAITADGAVWSWGEGEHSCLGHGENLANQLLPKKVEAWPPGAGAGAVV